MNWRITEIDEFKDFGFRQALHLKDFKISYNPGQIIFIYQPEIDDHIVPLACVKDVDNQLWYTSDKPLKWQLGKKLYVRGPIGNGFNPIGSEGKILFIIPGEPIGSLQSLIVDAIQSQKNVAIMCTDFEWQIHPEVEIISFEDYEYAINWADYIYIECAKNELTTISEIISLIKKHCIPAEIFIFAPVLCGGNADCMVCTVHKKSGYRQICKEGPVISVEELELN
jgi:NAD(P)H-flavin reductase